MVLALMEDEHLPLPVSQHNTENFKGIKMFPQSS